MELLEVKNFYRVGTLAEFSQHPKIARVWGAVSSSQTGQEVTDPETLDVDMAITIAENWDDEMICLDYRSSFDNPRVLFSGDDSGPSVRWKTIAKDIKSFADYLGL